MKTITDDQVSAALDAQLAEFDCWSLTSFGPSTHRIIREPRMTVEGLADNKSATFDTYPLHDMSGDDAHKQFKFMRAMACMRKALETLSC